jgi:hypothetical protein
VPGKQELAISEATIRSQQIIEKLMLILSRQIVQETELHSLVE